MKDPNCGFARARQRRFTPPFIRISSTSGAHGDTGCHLHVHLVPKYRDGFEWGGVFAMNPGQTKLTDAQYAEMIEKIKAAL